MKTVRGPAKLAPHHRVGRKPAPVKTKFDPSIIGTGSRRKVPMSRWAASEPASEKQLRFLDSLGPPASRLLTKRDASELIDKYAELRYSREHVVHLLLHDES